MQIKITVKNHDGKLIHNRIGTIRAQYDSTRRAAFTRLTKRLMRIYCDQWQQIRIKEITTPNQSHISQAIR